MILAAARPRPSIAAVTGITSFGFIVVQLDMSIVNVALPRIGTALGGGVEALQWVVDAYALAFAGLLLSAGALGDRSGARKVFIIGLLIFTAASAACGLAPSSGLLIAARALQGVGAALLMPCSLALLNHACAHDPAARARAIGWWTAAGGFALAAGPLLGGVLVDRLGWPSIFLINLPLGLLGAALALRYLEETVKPTAQREFDLKGQALAIVTLVALTGAIIEAGTRGWRAPLVLGGLALAVTAALAFIWVEARGAAPMLPLHLFRQHAFSSALAIGLAVNLTVYGVIFVLSFYFQQARHYSPARTGLAFLPFMLLVTLANILGGRLAARYGTRRPMLAGLLIGAAGFVLLTRVNSATSYVSLIWRLLFIPLGIGLAVPPMTAATLAAVPKAQAGMASGVLNTVRQAAGAIGVALFGALLAGGIVAGMRTAFAVSAAVLAAAATLLCVGRAARGQNKTAGAPR